MLLIHEDLWNYINGTIPCPPSTFATHMAQGSIPTNQANISTWNQNDAKARFDILLSIIDHQIDLVHRLATFHEIWDRLKLFYEHFGIASQAFTHCRLVNHSLEGNASMPTFCTVNNPFIDFNLSI